jgi:hypothetical protein
MPFSKVLWGNATHRLIAEHGFKNLDIVILRYFFLKRTDQFMDFWVSTPCSLVGFSNVSENLTASIFRMAEFGWCRWWSIHYENASIRFDQNVEITPYNKQYKTQKIIFWVKSAVYTWKCKVERSLDVQKKKVSFVNATLGRKTLN